MKWPYINRLPFSVIGRDFLGFLVLCGISLLAGLLINGLREKPLPLVYQPPLERIRALRPAYQQTSRNIQTIVREMSPHDLRAALGKPDLVVMDARLRDFYEVEHIPGALNLSRERFDEDFNRLYPVLSDSTVKQIVVYCANATCEDSRIVATALAELGFGSIYLLKGGWAAWRKAESGGLDSHSPCLRGQVSRE